MVSFLLSMHEAELIKGFSTFSPTLVFFFLPRWRGGSAAWRLLAHCVACESQSMEEFA